MSIPAIAASGTALTPINGWKNYSKTAPRPAAYLIDGIVYLKGDIKTKGTESEPFAMPAALTPESRVYVKVTLCHAHNGRLNIGSTGYVAVETEGPWSDAQCLVSLDGASYSLLSLTSTSFKPLKLQNQWSDTGYGTAHPAARLINGVVHLQGAMSGGSGATAYPFVLSSKFAPAAETIVPLDMCAATNGKLVIQPDGTSELFAQNDFDNATCFTSLDGVTFALNSTGFTSLKLINSWKPYGFNTATPGVRLLKGGIVQFAGAIHQGTAQDAFVLPIGFRPRKELRVPTDMCNTASGRLDIATDGTVQVLSEVNFDNASCFTSLDGVSFHI